MVSTSSQDTNRQHDSQDLSSRRRHRWRRFLQAVLVLTVLAGTVVGPSVVGALLAPGTDSVAARVAEWGRDHGFDGLITWLEKQQYEHNPPPTGGMPIGGIPRVAIAPVTPSDPLDAVGLPAPAALHPPADLSPLPGEGVWNTVTTVHGRPAVRVAHVRPDRDHTSFLVGVMWIDPRLVRGQLHPGFQDPGGTSLAATSLTAAEQHGVVAVFNGGFRLNGASHGGYFSQGHTRHAP
jgi:hypothetical protein